MKYQLPIDDSRKLVMKYQQPIDDSRKHAMKYQQPIELVIVANLL